MAAKASAKPLRVLKTSDADFQAAWRQVCQRRVDTVESVEKDAKKIVDRVREGGDKELLACVRKYDGAKFDDIEQVLFHLRLLSNNSKVMVPEDNLDLVGLRPLGDKALIDELFATLEDGNIDTYKDWKGRYKQNLDKMKTGQLDEVAGVLKNLSLVSQKKSLSFREKKMYERAKYFIVSEVAQVRASTNWRPRSWSKARSKRVWKNCARPRRSASRRKRKRKPPLRPRVTKPRRPTPRTRPLR